MDKFVVEIQYGDSLDEHFDRDKQKGKTTANNLTI